MGVTIATKDGVTWYEFPGRSYGSDRYRAWVYSGRFCCFDRRREEPPELLEAELRIPVSLFKTVILSFDTDGDRGRLARKLGIYGVFRRESGDRISFTLPCGDRHVFQLEDLLILADQL